MSVTQTTFSQAEGTSTVKLKEWLLANASDFFDSITETGGKISLKKEGITYFDIGFDSQHALIANAYTNGNETVTATAAASASLAFRKAAKTSKGIAISIADTYTEYRFSVFICKTSSGGMGVILNKSFCTNDADYARKYYIISCPKTRIPSEHDILVNTVPSGMTVLAPVYGESSDDRLEGCFITPFSQYKGSNCVLNMNNEEYLYNGVVAMQ